MNDRNQPCKCGSGMKSKKCCENPEVKSKQYQAWLAERAERAKARAAQLQTEIEEYRRKRQDNEPMRFHGPGWPMMLAALAYGGGRR